MHIKVLGTGCPKCEKLTENVKEALQKAGLEAEVEKVTDIKTISSYGVMLTPALVIDGQVKAVGKLLKPEEIAKFI